MTTACRGFLVALYSLTVLLSAFLLFQIQPVIAKIILPWFGGTAAVWTTCLLFFQLMLLAGYLYAHGIIRRLAPKRQATLHVALLAASLLLLPIAPREAWKPQGSEDPGLLILGLLTASIGLPYFLLSTTGPLVQAWCARTSEGVVPYRLFALSNAGSLLALLSYPVVVEPFFASRSQTRIWSIGYLGFAFLCGAVAWRSSRFTDPAHPEPEKAPAAELEEKPPPRSAQFLWLALPACASTMLLAVTNHVTKNLAPIPFLWVLPLSLYLLSFILCFESERWYLRDWYLRLLLVALAGVAYGLSPQGAISSVKVVVSLFSITLFVCCMVCHGELARLKPHPQHLTSFYLMVALGGAVGGVFVALAAPRLFRGYFEMPVGMAACVMAVAFVLYLNPSKPYAGTQGRQASLGVAGLAVVVCAYLFLEVFPATRHARLLARNFYGVLGVYDSDDGGGPGAQRALVHAGVTHGVQFLRPERERWPTAYYGIKSGAGLALLAEPHQAAQRVGIVGLGAGVLASYGRPGDYYRFYEINPLVVEIAKTQFTFLRNCTATVDIVLGDARLNLEREASQQFDVLVIDAFSGDAIPVHLLTAEAFAVYFRHLKESGVLAIHTTNTYLDLPPVVKLSAKAVGKEAVLVNSPGDSNLKTFPAAWVLVTTRQEFLGKMVAAASGRKIDPRNSQRPWTDDYSNMAQILR